MARIKYGQILDNRRVSRYPVAAATAGRRGPLSDRIFRAGSMLAGSFVLVLIALMVFQLAAESWPIWEEGGLSFVTGTDWNAVEGRESYGALPYIFGTLVTAALAMAIGVPVSIGIAMFLSDAPARIAAPLGFVVELLAAVPSVIYGLWGLFIFRGFFRDSFEMPLYRALGDHVWFLDSRPFGLDILTASIILAIMIIPTVSAVSREIMRAVPQQQKEAAYMLGATRWEMFKLAVFPYSKTGLVGASILGLGRAVGETMAVTMLIGNAIGERAIVDTLFDPGQSIASILANEFAEATPGTLQVHALIGLALILLALAMAINVVAHMLVTRMLRVREGAINN